ncbi:MAG: YigZ family protein [Lentihominibacter sp.]|jgi:uncharacterized YigZ family protein
MELYKTIAKEVSETQIIEKSRFIAHARPVETREEAEAFIAGIRTRYKDATHNVPAMVLGDRFQIQWASDDGEPQGTSGAPMVHMMVNEGLTNLVIVVTRYFGGVKLGTGGLVRAYTSSARMAIDAAGVCSVQEVCRMTFRIDYTYLTKIQQLAAEKITGKAREFSISDISYDDKVNLSVVAIKEAAEPVKELFANITSGSAELMDSVRTIEKIQRQNA